MSKILVIVESPGKIKKISEILGPNYIIKASFGHCQDLDSKTLSIDIDNNYNPIYKIIDSKQNIVKDLRSLVKSSSEVILASDEDREGEAIAYSLASLLGLKNPKRIVFHEITKKAIIESINNPKQINMKMVHAQQARRLLDRLVGYKISPLLWTHIPKQSTDTSKTEQLKTIQSAGRVQSVVVKIIIDKENDINNSINNSYYKTTIEFIKNKIKFNGTLMINNNLYLFENVDNAKTFLNLINKQTIFKVLSIENKESIRKPSPPFITSTLQQEASTKLGFNVKKTMEVAQKLYEEGHITYMRTDSTNLSQEALNDCKKYIEDTYGPSYSKPNKYTNKNSNAQEAHEAIRPTHIENIDINSSNECLKLYNLIWRRTVASQMTPAKINIQTIKIDTLNDLKSILNEALWISNYESTIFDGFMILYNNTTDSEELEKGNINININDLLKFKKIKINEEYTKSPLRYNEANLINYLEKNNIGRPSTFASIINKIIDRDYVEIKNIDGITKLSNQLHLDNKYKLKEQQKEVIIGKENKKLVPTEKGILINGFMIQHFESIMEINFTSQFEIYLDKISEGTAKWYNVLDIFYKMFNPMVEKLQIENVKEKQDKILGIDPNTNKQIYIGTGKYGPYIKILYDDKWRYTSIETEDITLEQAINILKYPLKLGKYNKKYIYLCKGKYGLYLKYNEKNISLNNIDESQIDLNNAIIILKNKII
jgi:DNA topoisomerase-1